MFRPYCTIALAVSQVMGSEEAASAADHIRPVNPHTGTAPAFNIKSYRKTRCSFLYRKYDSMLRRCSRCNATANSDSLKLSPRDIVREVHSSSKTPPRHTTTTTPRCSSQMPAWILPTSYRLLKSEMSVNTDTDPSCRSRRA